MECNCNSKDILEHLESDLTDLRGLLNLLYDYFNRSKEHVQENPYELTVRYSQYGSLTNACMKAVDKMLQSAENEINLN